MFLIHTINYNIYIFFYIFYIHILIIYLSLKNCFNDKSITYCNALVSVDWDVGGLECRRIRSRLVDDPGRRVFAVAT